MIDLDASRVEATREALPAISPRLRVMGVGASVEIYKEVGLPADVVRRFAIADMSGTHGIGHTRMATEFGRHDPWRAPFLDRARSVPGSQRLALQPQQSAPRTAPSGHAFRDRERYRSRRGLSDAGA